jgi:hypothetical protein
MKQAHICRLPIMPRPGPLRVACVAVAFSFSAITWMNADASDDRSGFLRYSDIGRFDPGPPPPDPGPPPPPLGSNPGSDPEPVSDPEPAAGGFHPADHDRNWIITIDELTGYGAAWRAGMTLRENFGPVSISHLTRAGYLWRNGGRYRQGEGEQTWVPTE